MKPLFIEEIRSANLTGYVKLYDWPPGTRSSIFTTRPQYPSAHPGMRRREGCLRGRRMRNPIRFHKGRNVPEVLQDGVEVCLVDRNPEQMACAAVKLLQDPQLRQGWARQPDKNAQLFSWEKAVKRCMETYFEIWKT